MKRFSASDIVLKVLGVLLLTAAVLKGHELLTVPTANQDLWSWRPVLIFQVEFELALGIWLLSGVFKRLAWLAGLACFGLFCGVTLYKGLTGAASCGCFGTVHVNPWVTLLAIDLPAVVALGLFRPVFSFAPVLSFLRSLPTAVTGGRESLRQVVAEFAKPLPTLRRFAATAALSLAILGLTTPILALNKPATVTSSYEILEPQTWVGRELPILEHIDIGEYLRQGNWLVVLYHHDCPDCQAAIPRYEQMARDLEGNEDSLRIALVEMPPYGQSGLMNNTPCSQGRLDSCKKWFVTTPVAILTVRGTIEFVWVLRMPDLENHRVTQGSGGHQQLSVRFDLASFLLSMGD